MSSNRNLRIGIVDRTTRGWTGGSTYTRAVVFSLGDVCRGKGVELFVLSARNQKMEGQKLGAAKILSLPDPTYFRGEPRLRQFVGLPQKSTIPKIAEQNKLSVLLPLSDIPPGLTRSKAVGWIPDFQHVRLPDMFSEVERHDRDQGYGVVARESARVILSSQDALHDFSNCFPEYASKGSVASFPSPLFAFEQPQGDPSTTLRKFHLPEKFALVVNQFWLHKNHMLVIDAITQLRRKGISIPVVMVGLPNDPRDLNNRPMSTILQAVASGGLRDQITLLGLVDHQDLVNLMRIAAVMIQPSRFEGWSTPVQDAKALGRPLICSDIPVHREQVPDALGFVKWDDPNSLAALLADTWKGLEPGPNTLIEGAGLAREREFAKAFGASLLNICQQAIAS